MAGDIQLTPNSKVVVVGAGVFGLSTCLHLVERGYKDITIIDRQPFDQNHYAEEAGAHGASCDVNKIIRASYGGEKLYQDLAFETMPIWTQWNEDLSHDSDLQKVIGNERLWHNCGFLRLSRDGLEEKERQTQEGFPKEIKHTQYRVSDDKRVEDALKEGIRKTKIDPFGRRERSLPVDGVLDMTAGFALASRACAFALARLKKNDGVKAHFGPDFALKEIVKDGQGQVQGIVTTSGKKFDADLIVVASGGWTPSLVPDVEHLLETTAGSVLAVQLPRERKDLWDKYSEENFPVWSWNMGSYEPHNEDNIGGLYGLPRTPEGVVKVAFRGAKWTSYSKKTSDGQPLSYPNPDVDKVPAEAMRVIRSFCQENLPDLLTLPLSNIRLCWYTDSIDNSWLIDHVPGTPGLVVASGGSGHGFKFLPVLGKHIVDVIESKNTAYTRLFKWRAVPKGKRNGLEQGPEGWRVLEKQKMVGKDAWRSEVTSRL